MDEKGTTPKSTTLPAGPNAPANGAAQTTTNTSGRGAGTQQDTTKLTSGLTVVTHSADNATPTQPKLPKASTNIEWGVPIGLPIRKEGDEPLVIFQRAVGINSDLAPAARKDRTPGAAEHGRRLPTGMYRRVIEEKRRRRTQHTLMSWCLNLVHFTQIVLGATLTALGPNARLYTVPITVLGALNTVISGFLALLKGQGLPERLHKDQMVYQRLQEWIEETESLLATGVIGRNNGEVGVLVESAFKKFNSAKLSEENNRPDNYVADPGTADTKKKTLASHSLESKPVSS